MMKRPNRLHMIIPNPDRAARLNCLGAALGSRFERTGSMHDLNAALEANEKDVKLIPHDHPNRAMCLTNLGIVLGSRVERTGSMDDLNAAVDTKDEPVKLTPHDHPDRAA